MVRIRFVIVSCCVLAWIAGCSAAPGDGGRGSDAHSVTGDGTNTGDSPLGSPDGLATNDAESPDSATTQDDGGTGCPSDPGDDDVMPIPTGCACVPGAVHACYPGDSSQVNLGTCRAGMQTCTGDGEIGQWSDCTGAVLPSPEMCDGMDHDCDGTPDDSATCACTPGTTQRCYSGPPGTLGVGICRAGTQTCTSDGTGWGPCVGQVVPRTETTCDGMDDDCSGTPDDGLGCMCTAGQLRTCYDGPAGTSGVGICHGGIQTCNAGGMGWSTCIGEVTPGTETCFTDADENCDGRVDEGCPACDTTAVIYANTASELYRVDPTTFAVTLVGALGWPPGADGEQMTDIAALEDGELYGVSFYSLYRVNRTTAACTLVAPLTSGDMFNALTFLPPASPGASQTLVAATTTGNFYRINTTTAAATLIGNYGHGAVSDGDIVSVASAGTFATVGVGSVGELASVDGSTGAATLIGTTGVSSTWGLAYWDGLVFGFLDEGAIVTINPATGASTRVAETPAQAWWGAAVTTCAPNSAH